MHAIKVPLAEQIEELETEYYRRQVEYQTMLSDGRQRPKVAEMKQERLNAAIYTLSWLSAHADLFRDFILYATRLGMRTEYRTATGAFISEAPLPMDPMAEEINMQDDAQESAECADPVGELHG